jgi:hypothetical protein
MLKETFGSKKPIIAMAHFPALPGSPANPVTKRAAKPKPRSAKLETPGTKPAAAKRAAPAKPAKAKTKAEPSP